MNLKQKMKQLNNDSKSSSSKSTKKEESTEKINKKKPKVSIIKLFRFATTQERITIVIAIICSIITGALQPVSILIYGLYISDITNILSSTADKSILLHSALHLVHMMLYIGTVALISAYISTCLWIKTGESQTRHIRSLYLHSMLHQDMSWYDTLDEGSLSSRLASDTQLIQDGISDNFGMLISCLSQFIAGFAVAFYKGWQMALIMFSTFPILVIIGLVIKVVSIKTTIVSQRAYAQAGLIAEQAIQSICTIYAFNLQKRFSQLFETKLDVVFKLGLKRCVKLGLGFASFMFCFYSSFGLALWYGTRLVSRGDLTGDSVFVIFLSITTGSVALAKLPTYLSAVTNATGASFQIFAIIDHIPSIYSSSNSSQGLKPKAVVGAIKFKNLCFKYPSRPDITVLSNISLKIEPGKTVAFVGHSGSGKSTIVQLVQRFYDPCAGQITLDDQDLKALNVSWLRQNIGIVGQEPVLFNMTIHQNLTLGDETISDRNIIHACQEANCHNFIIQLPNGYNTLVGEHSNSMLSGGQKQRIAIARAILKNPRILLLDEATSALDTQSEQLVQNALNKASASRTTIVVAHRLSTIVNADLIVMLDQGQIIEQGNHQELVDLNGKYAELVEKQVIDINQKEDIFDDDDDILLQEENQLEAELEKVISVDSSHYASSNTNTTSSKFTIEIKENLMETTLSSYNSDPENTMHQQHKKQQTEEGQLEKYPIWKLILLRIHPDERRILILGIVGASIAGCILPLYAYSFSNVIALLIVPSSSTKTTGSLQGTNLYAFSFFILGLASFIGTALQYICFALCSEYYTRRLRSHLFATFLKQQVSFFDENKTGALKLKLDVDALNVSEMINKVWGDVAQLFAVIVSGLTLAMVHSWELSLITLTIAPFIVASTSYEMYIQDGFEDQTKKANAQSGHVATEAIREFKTVAALNKQSYFEERYRHATQHPHQLAMRKAYLSSIGSALYRGIMIYANALAFYVGTRLVMNGNIDFRQMFTSMTVLMTTAQTAGRNTMFATALSKGKSSAMVVFDILQRKPNIDSDLEGLEPVSVHGSVQFEKIKFAYPARPDQVVFNGKFTLKGDTGKTIALVGPSGCGKSTVIGLLERWYDPLQGVVSLDEKNIKSYSLCNLRSHMALVGQEPVLFDLTIGENIRFGVEHDRVTQEQVEDACKASNIHEFISNLPKGYDTRVGDKGSRLSGGQKQRIAIARALIRRPKVLLLDEATSALDSNSEQVVQEALDNIIKEGGRTIITIAHRLSTITQADIICVIKDGRVKEQGTHWELLNLNGIYSKLIAEQSLAGNRS